MYEVSNLIVDIINYDGLKQFQFKLEYINDCEFRIIAKRLDTLVDDGWDENISILITDLKNNMCIYNIGISPSSIKISDNIKDLQIFTPLQKSQFIEEIKWFDNYETLRNIDHYYINNYTYIDNVKIFNEIFDTDIIYLPHTILAVGIKNQTVYKYHHLHSFNIIYEISLTIEHIVNVFLKYYKDETFYFLICNQDGYMVNTYNSLRKTPYIYDSDLFFLDKTSIECLDDDKYPLLHKNKYVLGQNVQINNDYVIAVPDRYYFCLHKYNKYRSVHSNIPFCEKISNIVYAGRNYGYFYNFISRRDIKVNQREYFKSDFVPKDNIFSPDYFINVGEMIKYKYILDIDGESSTWEATAWKLNSNSVIFKTKSIWKQWFFHEYKEWIHFVPINEDFSDIEEKFEWCEKNQEECNKIIQNARELFQRVYCYSNVEKYTKNTIDILLEEIKKNNKNFYYNT